MLASDPKKRATVQALLSSPHLPPSPVWVGPRTLKPSSGVDAAQTVAALKAAAAAPAAPIAITAVDDDACAVPQEDSKELGLGMMMQVHEGEGWWLKGGG